MANHGYNSAAEDELISLSGSDAGDYPNYEMDDFVDQSLQNARETTARSEDNQDADLETAIQQSLNDYSPNREDEDLEAAIQRSLEEINRMETISITRADNNIQDDIEEVLQRSLLDFAPKEPEEIIIEAMGNGHLMDTDKLIIPLGFMDTVCGSNNLSDVTVFKIRWISNPDIYTYATLSDFSPDSDFVQMSPTKLMEINPNMDTDDVLCVEMRQTKDVPKCTKLVLEPSTPAFLDIKDQFELVNGVIGTSYRVFWKGQYLSIYSTEIDQVINFTVLDTGSEFRDGLAQAVDIDVEITFSCDEKLIAKWKSTKQPVSTLIPQTKPVPVEPKKDTGNVLNQMATDPPAKLSREELRAKRMAFYNNNTNN